MSSAKLSRSDLISSLQDYLYSFQVAEAATPVKLTRADDAAHDAYFHIGRVEGDACVVLICAVLSCRMLLVTNVPDPSSNTLGDPALRIDAALAVLLGVVGR